MVVYGVEYKMTEVMAKEIIKNHKGPRKHPQNILIDYVNAQCGLLKPCVKVLISG